MRSGIGPRKQLEAHGIDVLLDQPAVGANLIDHQQTGVSLIPRPGVCSMDNPLVQLLGRYTAHGSGQFNDMQLFPVNHVDLTQFPEMMAALGGHPMLFTVATGLQRPNSRGSLSLASADCHVQPVLDLNYFADEEDMRRMVAGMRLCWEIANTPAVRAMSEGIVMLTQEVVDNDEALAEFIRMTASTIFHPVGTCRMGPESDPDAVVDQYCRVRGVEHLRVVDASIMPNIVRANTNLTCMMIGEHVADLVKTGR
jgi:choline dehydrogenase